MRSEGKETVIEATVRNTETSEVPTFCRERNNKYHYVDVFVGGLWMRINVSLGQIMHMIQILYFVQFFVIGSS